MVSFVVAQANNRVIGKSNELPWYLPADLKHFKELTSGHMVVMGRKTYESIINRLGKPLPNRQNVVITANRDYSAPGCRLVGSVEEALKLGRKDEVFVIGGASVYKEALPFAGRIYMTKVKANIEGDTFFPKLKTVDWTPVARELHAPDDKNEYSYEFITYERTGSALQTH
jgi:dihydrofolate reductase